MPAKKIRLSGRSRAKNIQRYAVFSGEQFYPGGGWNDYRSSHTTLEAAREAHALEANDWIHIVDLHTGKLVFEKEYK